MNQAHGWRTEAHIESFKMGPDGVYIPHHHQVVPNIITDVGDLWINNRIVDTIVGYSETNPITAPTGMTLGTGTTAAVKGNTWVETAITGEGGTEYQAFSAVTDDEANVRVSWAASWDAAAAGVAGITEVIIGDNGGSDTEAIVRVVFAPVDKSADDTPLNITIHWTNAN